jgi:tRNA nucleotidyltransferase (CCA-adding enzyme)
MKLGPKEQFDPNNSDHLDSKKYKIVEYEKTGRRPTSVSFNVTLKGDMSRRDLTVNAMAIDKNGIIYDYFDGKKSVQNKILKTVGNPYERFSEDFLRLLRVPRFAAKLGFEIDKKTGKAIKQFSDKILDIAPERIKDEILKAASTSGDVFASYILQLDKLKILKHILPEVMNLKWFRENLSHHPETKGKGGTVWAHTMEALKISNTADPIKNLAILLHDVGKGVSLSHEKGLPRYLGHARSSVKLVNDIADRLKMSTKEKNSLLFAVGNHMKFHNILNMKPSKIAKLVSDDNWDVLEIVGRADEFARGEAFKHKGEFEKIVDKAVKIKEKFNLKTVEHRLKLVDGNHVMDITGLKPGKKVGQIIRNTTNWILDNDISDKKEIDDYIKGQI